MRKQLWVLSVLAVISASGCKSHVGNQDKGEALVPFDASTPPKQIEVLNNGNAYKLSYFSGDKEYNSNGILNIYLIPPPVRYKYYPNNQKFGYWLQYTGAFTSTENANLAATAAESRFDAGPFVILALPGTFGTDGDQTLTHDPDVIGVVDGAIDRLKELYAANRVNVVGHSLTAAIAASLLSRRSDLQCVYLSSGPYDLADDLRQHGWPTTYAGVANPFSAVEQVRRAKPDPNRKIVLIGDPQDRRVPFRYSEQMLAALSHQGIAASLDEETASDPDHHGLQMYAVQEMMKCAGESEPRQ